MRTILRGPVKPRAAGQIPDAPQGAPYGCLLSTNAPTGMDGNRGKGTRRVGGPYL